MSTTTDALTGLWVDYSRGNRTHILASDFWATFMTTLVAISITVSAPYIFKILASIIIQLNGTSKVDENAGSGVTDPLLPGSRGGNQQHTEAHTNEKPENSVWKIVAGAKGAREMARAVLIIIIISAAFVSFGAQVIAGAFSADIATSRAARSSSTHCGIWEFDDENAGDEAAARSDIYNYQREARAGYYAQNCFSSETVTDSTRCDFFYNSSIDFTPKSFDRCPFKSQDLCRGGLYSAVTFDTGLIDASNIGVNSKTTHKFRRQTTCSPLNMDEPYVRRTSSNDSTDTTYRYFYGSINDDDGNPTKNHTYETSGTPFNWLAPVYSLMTYSTTLYPEYDYWRPIPELEPNENSTVTIFFISSMHIYHIKPSYDPIFPATDPYRIPEYHEPYYYNSDPRAQALACVDTTELCSPDGKTCWSMTSGLPAGIPDTPGYWFMKWSLEASNVYDAIKWRLGSALLAQQKVSSSVSQPLSDRHWEKEAERLFTTSLARIQSDAWSIATAEGRNEPGYIEVTHDEGRGRLCGIYKFKSIGFKNVSLAGFVLLLMVPFLTLLFSLEVNTAKKVFCSCCCYPRTRGKPQGEVRDSQAEVGDSQDELEPSRGEAGGSQYKDDYPKTFLVVNFVLLYLFKLLIIWPLKHLLLGMAWFYDRVTGES